MDFSCPEKQQMDYNWKPIKIEILGMRKSIKYIIMHLFSKQCNWCINHKKYKIKGKLCRGHIFLTCIRKEDQETLAEAQQNSALKMSAALKKHLRKRQSFSILRKSCTLWASQSGCSGRFYRKEAACWANAQSGWTCCMMFKPGPLCKDDGDVWFWEVYIWMKPQDAFSPPLSVGMDSCLLGSP